VQTPSATSYCTNSSVAVAPFICASRVIPRSVPL
jgi:hypothetical protein